MGLSRCKLATEQNSTPKPQNRRKISNSTFWLLMLVGLLPSLVAALVNLQSQRLLLARGLNNLQASTDRLANSFSEHLEVATTELCSLAANPLLGDAQASIEQKLSELRLMKNESVNFEELFVVSADTGVLASTSSEPGQFSLQKDWVRQMRDGGVITCSSVRPGEAGPEGLLLISAIKTSPDAGELMLVGLTGLNKVAVEIERFTLGYSGFALLANEDGLILAGNVPGLLGQNVSTALGKPIGNTSSSQTVDGPSETTGNYYTVARTLPQWVFPAGGSWQVLVAQRRTEILESSFSPATWSLFTVLVIMPIILILGLLFTSSVRRSFDFLITATKKIASGDFTPQPIDRSYWEIGELAKIFEEMKDDLARSSQQIMQYQLRLEELVDQRTKELRDSEEKYRILYESSRDALMLIAPEEGFLSGNPAALNMFGYKDENEFASKTFGELSPQYQPDGVLSSEKAQDMIATAMKEGSHLFEWKCELADGKKFFATILLTGMELQGRKVLQATVRDISERKRMEERLRQAKKNAEDANSAKSQFLAHMSHELRTPLAAILGYTDVLMDPVLSTSDRNNNLVVVRRNGEQLLTLINDILDLSKIEARKLTMEIRPCSALSVLADVVSIMRVRAEQCNTSLSVRYVNELPETILTDSDRLRQAIANLVGNAVKFTENGSVEIVTTFLPRWRDEKPAVQIEVVDTGIGISEEGLSHLFDPFVQAEASTSRKYGGTGLGLTITHHIAELLGGELTAKSSAGAGSTFTLIVPTGSLEGVKMLTCPAEAIQELATKDHYPTTRDLTGLRVLVAEDGIDNRRLVHYLLKEAGAVVEVAENGKEAVQKANTEHFDVILMDMQMPEMDGYEATRTLRNQGLDKPILALTAHALSSDRERCLAAGCDEHLAKPISRDLLIQTVAKYGGKRIASDEPLADSEEKPSADGDDPIMSQLANDPGFAEILDPFVSDLSSEVEQMRQALASGQYEELQGKAHQLKGAGGSYGYPVLTDVSKILEDAAKNKDVEGAGLALKQLELLCRRIIAGHSVNILSDGGQHDHRS